MEKRLKFKYVTKQMPNRADMVCWDGIHRFDDPCFFMTETFYQPRISDKLIYINIKGIKTPLASLNSLWCSLLSHMSFVYSCNHLDNEYYKRISCELFKEKPVTLMKNSMVLLEYCKYSIIYIQLTGGWRHFFSEWRRLQHVLKVTHCGWKALQDGWNHHQHGLKGLQQGLKILPYGWMSLKHGLLFMHNGLIVLLHVLVPLQRGLGFLQCGLIALQRGLEYLQSYLRPLHDGCAWMQPDWINYK